MWATSDAQGFLTALVVVLGVAGLTSVLFQKLRQPVVLGYLIAGLIIGPHVAIPLVADPAIVHTLSELGVILVMFGIGLELDLGRLVRAMPRAGTTALLETSAMLWLGYVVGLLFGWSQLESIFTGAVIAISSTTIIAKAFDEQQIQGRLRELVVAILIVEDLVAVLLIAILAGVASGSDLGASELALAIGKLVGFLALVVAIGIVIVPRIVGAIVRLGRTETTVIGTVAICFSGALLAHEAGYSVALGAFIAGVLVGKSGETRQIEPLIRPLRDIFAAIFFVAVGMLIDPAMIAEHWVAIVVLSLVVVVGKFVFVTVGAFLTGHGTRTSIAAGTSLAQIGELSFVIAAVGTTLGAVGAQLYPIAVAVSALTTLTTPWLIRAAKPFGRFVDRKLPKPLQTVVGFYESWIERMRAARRESRSQLRRLIRILVLDVCVVAAIVIGFAVGSRDAIDFLVDAGLDPGAARIVVVVGAGAVALPFCVGVLVTTRRFARRLAASVVPPVEPGHVDLGRPSRMMLEAVVLLAGVLMAGLPLVALTQPFLSGYTGAIVLLVAVSALGFFVWRKARNLHGHVRAVSHVVVEALAARAGGKTPEPPVDVLSGLGTLDRISITRASFGANRSLAELALRATTGATVLAILRDGHGIATPDAHEPLRAGDVVALAGTPDAIAAATALLARGQQPR